MAYKEFKLRPGEAVDLFNNWNNDFDPKAKKTEDKKAVTKKAEPKRPRLKKQNENPFKGGKTMELSKLDRAILYAAKAHAGVCRKSTTVPYIVHPVEAMKIVSSLTENEDVRAAAVLHDTVEDTGTTLADIEREFGAHVAELVGAQSENKREGTPETETWRVRKEEALSHLEKTGRDVKILYLGDKLANMRDIARDFHALHEELWKRFNAPDNGQGLSGKAASIGWYYRGIAERLRPELADTAAWQEYDALVAEVFEQES